MIAKAIEEAEKTFWEEWKKPDTKDFIDCMRSAIKAYEKAMWQPIDSAPKDGVRIIVYRPTANSDYIPRVGIDYWFKNRAWGKSNCYTQPTHWRPLPYPPENEK